jgi:hypothetical protein
MDNLDTIGAEVSRLHNRLSLRPTLVQARAIGELLLDARAQMRYGDWLPWVRKYGLHPRMAQLYIQVAKADPPEFDTTIKEFLNIIRNAKFAARTEERKIARKEAAKQAGKHDIHYVFHADCRKFKGYPSRIDCVATDPPWQDKGLYRWLAKFCGKRLRPGGLLLVQCYTGDIAEVLGILGTELQFCWLLAIVYSETQFATSSHFPFRNTWRPILVLSKGQLDTKGLGSVTDAITHWNKDYVKLLHPWQQPLRPWLHWIERLGTSTNIMSGTPCWRYCDNLDNNSSEPKRSPHGDNPKSGSER